MRNLIEGLRQGDLEDLVLPMISVDEYESRIDDTAIVVAFYVSEKDAAQDLNRFIQRSPVEILDTEISPAPDSKGYYMVFVEMLGNAKLGENVESVLEEIASLTSIGAWKMKMRGMEDLQPFDAALISKTVSPPDADPVRESVLDLLSNSELLDARFEADTLYLESAHAQYAYHVKAVGTLDAVTTETQIAESATRLDLGAIIGNRKLENALGAGWTVNRIRDLDVLYHHETERALALFPA